MNYNKREYRKLNDKKVLHKVRKQWVVVSMALLGMLGVGAVHAEAHAATNGSHVDPNQDVKATNQNHQQAYSLTNSNSSQKQGNQQSNVSSQSAPSSEQITDQAQKLTARLMTNSAMNQSNGQRSVTNSSNSNDQTVDNNHSFNNSIKISNPAINRANELSVKPQKIGLDQAKLGQEGNQPVNRIRKNKQTSPFTNFNFSSNYNQGGLSLNVNWSNDSWSDYGLTGHPASDSEGNQWCVLSGTYTGCFYDNDNDNPQPISLPESIKRVAFGNENGSKVNATESNGNGGFNMGPMFASDSSLTSINLSGLDTSNVTNMSAMFLGDTGLTSINLSGLDTSNVTNMSAMFQSDMGLPSSVWSDQIKPNFAFNNNSVSLSYMFQGASNLNGGNSPSLQQAGSNNNVWDFNGSQKYDTMFVDDSGNPSNDEINGHPRMHISNNQISSDEAKDNIPAGLAYIDLYTQPYDQNNSTNKVVAAKVTSTPVYDYVYWHDGSDLGDVYGSTNEVQASEMPDSEGLSQSDYQISSAASYNISDVPDSVYTSNNGTFYKGPVYRVNVNVNEPFIYRYLDDTNDGSSVGTESTSDNAAVGTNFPGFTDSVSGSYHLNNNGSSAKTSGVNTYNVHVLSMSPVYEFKYVNNNGQPMEGTSGAASNESASDNGTPNLPPTDMLTPNPTHGSAARKFTTSVYASASGTPNHNSYYGDEYLVVDQVEPIANTLDAVNTDETSASNSVSSMSSTTTASSNAAVRPFMNAASNAVSVASTEISNNTEPDQASAHQIIADVRTANGKEAVAASALANGDSTSANAASNSTSIAAQTATNQFGRVQSGQPGYSDASNAASKAINDSNVAKNNAQNADNSAQTVSNYAHDASSYAATNDYSHASDFANKAASEVASVDQDNASAESASVDASNQASLAEAAVNAGSAFSAASSMANTSAGKDSANGQSSASSAINSAEGVISNASQTIHSVVNKANPTQDNFNNASNAAISANSAAAAAGNVLASVDDSNAATDSSNASKAYTSASNNYAVPSGQPGYTSASSAISAASNDASNASDAARDAATASTNASTAAQNASNAANARHASDAASYAHDAASYAHDADNDAYTASSASSDAKNQLSAASDADSSALDQDSSMASSASNSDYSMSSTSAGKSSASNAIHAASSIASSASTEIHDVKINPDHTDTDMNNAASAGLNAASAEASAASILASADSSSASTDSSNASNDYTSASNNYAVPSNQPGYTSASNAIKSAGTDSVNASNAASTAKSDSSKASTAAHSASSYAAASNASSASIYAHDAASYAHDADNDAYTASSASSDAKNQLSAASDADSSALTQDSSMANSASGSDSSMSKTPAGQGSANTAIHAASVAAANDLTAINTIKGNANHTDTNMNTAANDGLDAASNEAVAASALASADDSSAGGKMNDTVNKANEVSAIADTISDDQPGYAAASNADVSAEADANAAVDASADAEGDASQVSADASAASSYADAKNYASASSAADQAGSEVASADSANAAAAKANTDASEQESLAQEAVTTASASVANASMSNTPVGQDSTNGQSAASSAINSASTVVSQALSTINNVVNNAGRNADNMNAASAAAMNATSAEAVAASALASADDSSANSTAMSGMNTANSVASIANTLQSGQPGYSSASSAASQAETDMDNLGNDNGNVIDNAAQVSADNSAASSFANHNDYSHASSAASQAAHDVSVVDANEAAANAAGQDIQDQLGAAKQAILTQQSAYANNASVADQSMSNTPAGQNSANGQSAASSIINSASSVAASASTEVSSVSSNTSRTATDVANASSAVLSADSAEAQADSALASADASSTSSDNTSASNAYQSASHDAIPSGQSGYTSTSSAIAAASSDASQAHDASSNAADDSSEASTAARSAAADAANHNNNATYNDASKAASYAKDAEAQRAAASNAAHDAQHQLSIARNVFETSPYFLSENVSSASSATASAVAADSTMSSTSAGKGSASSAVASASAVAADASEFIDEVSQEDPIDVTNASSAVNDAVQANSAEAVAASAVASAASSSVDADSSAASADAQHALASADAIEDGGIRAQAQAEATSAQNAATDAATASTNASNDSSSASSAASKAATAAAGSNASSASSYASVANSYAQKAVSDNAKARSDASVASSASTSASEDYDLTHGQANLAYALYDENDIASASSEVNSLHNSDAAGTISAASSVINSASAAASSDAVTDATDAQTANANANDMAARSAEAVAASAVASEASNSASSVASEASEDYNGSATYDASSTASSMASSMSSVAASMHTYIQGHPNAPASAKSAASLASANASAASQDAMKVSNAASSASEYAQDASTDSSSASSYAKSASAEAKNGQIASARSDASNADREAKQAVADADKAAQYNGQAHDALNAINQFFDTYASNANGDRLVGDLPIRISYGDNNYLNTLDIELSDLLNTKGKNGRNGDNAMYVGDTYDLDNYGSEGNEDGSRGQGTLNKYIQDKFFGGANVKQMDPVHHREAFTNPTHLFVRFVNRDNVKGEPYDPNNDQLILQANSHDPNDEANPNYWINVAYVNGHEATDNGSASLSDDGVDYDIDHINWVMNDPFEYNYKIVVNGSNGLSTNSDGQIVGPNNQPIVPKSRPGSQNGTPNGQNIGPNGQNIPHNQGPAVGPHGPINSNTPNGQNNGEPNGDNGTGINNIGTPESADVVYTNADYDMLNANDHAITDDVNGLAANAGDVVYWTKDGVTPNGIAHRAGEAVSAHDVSENPKMFEEFTEHSNNRNPEDGTYTNGLKNVDSSILDGEGYNTGISVNYLPLKWNNYLNDNYVDGVPKGTAIVFDSAHRNNNDEELNGEDNIDGDIPNDDGDAGFTAPAKPSRTGDTIVVVPFRDEIPTNAPAHMHYVVPTNADEIPYAPINSGISPQQEYERGTEDKNGTFVPDSYNHGNLRWTTSAVKINVYKVDNGKPTLASSFTYHPNINAGDYVGRNDLLADTPYNSLNPYSESLLRALRIPSGYHFDTTHGDFMSDQEPFFVVPNGNSTVNYYLDKDAAPAKPNQHRYQSGNLPTPRPNVAPNTPFNPNPSPNPVPDRTPITPADSNHGQTTPNYGPGTKPDPNNPGHQIGSHVDPNDPDAVNDYNRRHNDPSVLADFNLLVNVQSNDGGNGIGQANVPVYVDVFQNSRGQHKKLNTVYQLSDANIRAAIVNAMTENGNSYQDYYNQKNDLWNDSIIRQLDNGQLNYDNKSLPIYYEITKDTDNKYHVIRVNSKGQALNEGYQSVDAGNYVFRPSEAIFDYTGHGHYRHTNDGNVETTNYTVPYLKSVRAEGYLGMKLDPHNFDFLRWGFDDDGNAPEGWTLDKIQNMKSLTLTGDDAQNYHRGRNKSGSLTEEDYNNGLVPVSYEYGKFYNGNTDINKNAKNGDDGSNEQQAAQQHHDTNPNDANTVDNVHGDINGIKNGNTNPSETTNYIVLGGNSMPASSAIDRIQKASHILSAGQTNATTTLNFFNPKSGMTVDRKTVNGAAGTSLPSLKLLDNIPTDYHLAPSFDRSADLKFGTDRPVNVPVVPNHQNH